MVEIEEAAGQRSGWDVDEGREPGRGISRPGGRGAPAVGRGPGRCARPALVGCRADHREQWQRSEHRAHEGLIERVPVRGGEERRGVRPCDGEREEYVVVARRVGMCLDDGLVVRVLVEVAADCSAPEWSRAWAIILQRPAAGPRTEVDGLGRPARDAGRPSMSTVDADLPEGVPRRQHERGDVRGLPGREAALLAGRHDGALTCGGHTCILPGGTNGPARWLGREIRAAG